MESRFLQNWMHYNSGDECSPDFHYWSGITLLGAALGRKVWIDHGKEYFRVFPNIYACLVSESGGGKSTARSRVKAALRAALPDYQLSSSMQSREDICVKMGQGECLRTWKNKSINMIEEYRPFFLVVNELKNFLGGADARKMIDFLVDIYDETEFSTGYKNVSSQKFYNPYVSMLACATPHWFMSELKIDLFTGGLGRRLFIICRERDKIVPNPCPPLGWENAKKACYEHLIVCDREATQGEVVRTQEAMTYWNEIYQEIKGTKIDDPILKNFYESKPIMVLKLALILSFDRWPFTYKCEVQDLKDAYSMLNALESDVKKLTGGIGTNPMAGVAQQMLQFIIVNNGMLQEKRLRQQFYKVSPGGERDYEEGKNHLKKTNEIVEFKQGIFQVVATLDWLKKNRPEEYQRNFGTTDAPKTPPSEGAPVV